MGKDSAARIELGRSFYQMGTVNEKVSGKLFYMLLFYIGPVFCQACVEGRHTKTKVFHTILIRIQAEDNT